MTVGGLAGGNVATSRGGYTVIWFIVVYELSFPVHDTWGSRRISSRVPFFRLSVGVVVVVVPYT